jgi:hypothetical protein
LNVTRLFLGVLFLVLLSGPAFAHGAGHAGHGGRPDAAATEMTVPGDEAPGPLHHRHDASVSFHCAVSASCAPLFLPAGDSAVLPTVPARAGWRITGDASRRSPVLERDPPVPRA